MPPFKWFQTSFSATFRTENILISLCLYKSSRYRNSKKTRSPIAFGVYVFITDIIITAVLALYRCWPQKLVVRAIRFLKKNYFFVCSVRIAEFFYLDLFSLDGTRKVQGICRYFAVVTDTVWI